MAILLVLTINLASAVIINSVNVPSLEPGQEGQIRIEVENILNDDVENVVLSLSFVDLPFIPIGTSTQSIDEIQEDDEESFVFTVKAASDATPGDYEIPYNLEYEVNNELRARTGTIGVKVRANPDLDFTINVGNPVLNKKGKVSLKIINKGFSDARFVSVKVLAEDFTLLSDDEVYIGSVDSDDFETVNFDVIFKKTNAEFRAILEYKDFDNKKVIETIELPFTVYTEKRAIELGIIQPDKTLYYVVSVIVLIVLFIIWRSIKKRRRLKRSMRLREGR
jgi:hypothetical protein